MSSLRLDYYNELPPAMLVNTWQPSPFSRAYHAGPARSQHIPLHAGVTVVNPKRLKQASVGGIVTKGGRTYIALNEHFVRTLEYTGTPLMGFGPDGKWRSSDQPVAVTVAYPGSRDPNEYIDMGLAEAKVPVSFEIPGIGIPSGHIAPVKGMRVIMNGAKTGLHRGTIQETNLSLWRLTNNSDGTSTYTLSKPKSKSGHSLSQLKGLIKHSIDSEPGDSGSWLIDEATKKVVGVHAIGGTGNTSELAVAYRADKIAALYGVSFVGRVGVVNPSGGTQTQPTPKVPVGTNVGSDFGRSDTTLPSDGLGMGLNPITAIISAIFNFFAQLFAALFKTA